MNSWNWKKLLGRHLQAAQHATDVAGGVISSTSSEGRDYSAFRLGVILEELYAIFGEQLAALTGGVSELMIQATERKAHVSRNIMANLGVSNHLISDTLKLEGALYSYEFDASDESSMQVSRQQASRIGNAISEHMSRVRSELDGEHGLQYDMGVFVARIALSARFFLAGAALTRSQSDLGARYMVIYGREILRVGAELTRILEVADGDGRSQAAFDQDFLARLRVLSGALGNPSGVTKGSVSDAQLVAEELLAYTGFLNTG